MAKKRDKKSGKSKKKARGKFGPSPTTARKSGGRKASKKGGSKVLAGTLEVNARGYGFVRPDQEGMPDVFIPARYMSDALHGDRVEARYFRDSDDGRLWGEISRVLEHGTAPVIGLLRDMTVIPRDPRFQAILRVNPPDLGGAEDGDVVVAEIKKRGPKGVFGRVIEVLGRRDSAGIESRIVLRTYGFEEAFPKEVEDELASIPDKVTERDLEGRQDLRGLFTITIDPERARDFDDALAIEKTKSGYRVWVSIADVSHYVKPGSPIDLEAFERGTSVYLPDRAVPMLPHELSSGICSLKPGEDRLAMTVEIETDKKGKRINAVFYTSVIKSDHRLTYEQVEELRSDPALRERFGDALPVVDMLKELSVLRRKRRKDRGSIDLDVPEAEVILDEDGEVVTILRSEQTWSHQLVEEFMLAANEAVASFMTDRSQPMVYRIHEPPFPASVEELADMLAPLGYQLLAKDADPDNIKPAHYQRVIEQSKGKPNEMIVNILCLRSMMQARYSDELAGHFGLASDRYCHFTSPIRRYPDLIVHRLLKRAIGAKTHHGSAAPADLDAAAAKSSNRERAAADAEREMIDLYAVLWMEKRLGQEFEGVINGVTSFGLFVVLDEAFVEGLIPLDEIDRRVKFNERELTLHAGTRRQSFTIGDRVLVSAIEADRERRKISFELIDKLD